MNLKPNAIFILILFLGCQPKKPIDYHEVKPDTFPTAAAPNDNYSILSDTTQEGAVQSDCVRGPAKPIIRKSVYPLAVFKLNDDHRTAIETLELPGGDKLIINNWGCEYFVLTFRFETERFQADTTDALFWLGKVTALMGEIEKGIDAPLDIKGGINAVTLRLSRADNQSYRLGDELAIREGDISESIVLDRIQKMGEKRFAIEVSYVNGPL